MAITISGSGITSSEIADGTITNADINASAAIVESKLSGIKAVKHYSVTPGTGLLTNVTYHGVTPTDTLSLAGKLTADTIAVKILVRYIHGGSTNHGYWTTDFYQSGDTVNRSYMSQAHYDWYYHMYHTEVTIPWDATGSTDLISKTISSHNTHTSNRYDVYYSGRIDNS